ncbi:MAG: hypothetical protein AAF203_05695, partial [Pseudomonadota bacterium]
MKTVLYKIFGIKEVLLFFTIFMVACGESKHSPILPFDQNSENQTEAQRAAELLEKPDQIIFSDVQILVLNPACVRCHSP